MSEEQDISRARTCQSLNCVHLLTDKDQICYCDECNSRFCSKYCLAVHNCPNNTLIDHQEWIIREDDE